jgi:hypothetical protein
MSARSLSQGDGSGYDFASFPAAALYAQQPNVDLQHWDSSRDDLSARTRSLSCGEVTQQFVGDISPIWCLSSVDGLIIAGCQNGSIEVRLNYYFPKIRAD